MTLPPTDFHSTCHVGRFAPYTNPANDSIVSGMPVMPGTPGATHCTSNAIVGDPRCFRACADTGPGTRTCMEFPDFAPTAQKQ